MTSLPGTYLAFEDRFRGPSSLITQRLRAYEPFIRPVAQHLPSVPTIDLGCGRGEWLALMASHGLACTGVDADQAMIASCSAKGLEAVQADMSAYLAALPSSSRSIISSFHVAEHLEPPQLQQLFKEAYRALVPGGLLIIETPNPDNLRVSSYSFYLDPTHIRPIPPPYLEFLADHAGFDRHLVLGLQEDPAIHTSDSLSLLDVFKGASPDYAIVAQKYSPGPVYLSLSTAFSLRCGMTFSDLVLKYEQQQHQRLTHIVEQQRLAQSQLRQELDALYMSRSWRLTAPLRRSSTCLKAVSRKVSRPVLPHLGLSTIKRTLFHQSRVRRAVIGMGHLALRHPWLHKVARSVYRRMIAKATSQAKQVMPNDMAPSSSRSSEIFLELQAAFQHHNQSNS